MFHYFSLFFSNCTIKENIDNYFYYVKYLQYKMYLIFLNRVKSKSTEIIQSGQKILPTFIF